MKRVFTKEQTLEIIDDYSIKNLTLKEIAKKFKTKGEKISNLLKANGILPDRGKYMRTPLSIEDELNIVKEYIEEKRNMYDVRTKYHIDQNSFWRILKKYGHKTRKPNDVNTIMLTDEQFNQALEIYNKFNSMKMAAKYIKVRASIIKRNFIARGVEIKEPKHSTVSLEKWTLLHGEDKAKEMWNKWSKTIGTRNSGKKSHLWGKPPKQGCGTGWKGWYKSHYFRSLRELAYMIYMDDNNMKWKSAECKALRFEYKNYDGKARTSVSDFLVGNRLIEIKPKKLHNTPCVMAKKAGAEIFCKNNGLVYELIDCEVNPNKIKTALDCGNLKFDRDYEKRFLEYIKTKSQ